MTKPIIHNEAESLPDTIAALSTTYSRLAAIALALAAPVFALTTWQVSYSALASRHYGKPVLIVETVVILLAMLAGFQARSAFVGLSKTCRIVLPVWAAVVVIAAVGASRPSAAITHAAITLLHGLFVLALWGQFTGGWRGERRALLTAMAWGAAAYAGLVHILALTVLDDPTFSWINFGPGVSNVRQLAFYGLTLAGIGLGLLATEAVPRRRWFQGTLLFLGYYMIDWSGGRAGFLAVITTTVLVLALAPREVRWRTALVAIAAFVGAMPLSLVFVPDEKWGLMAILDRADPRGSNDYSSGRLEMWRQTARAISERWLFGHGEGQFRREVLAAAQMYNHPHNAPLQFLYQWGFVGTLALSTALLAVPRKLVALARAEPEVALPAIGTLVGMLAMSMLEGNFFHIYPVMVSLVSLAALMSVAAERTAASA